MPGKRLTKEQLIEVCDTLDELKSLVQAIMIDGNNTFISEAKARNFNLPLVRSMVHSALKLHDPETYKEQRTPSFICATGIEELYCDVFNLDPNSTQVNEYMPPEPVLAVDKVFYDDQSGLSISRREAAVMEKLYFEEMTLEDTAKHYGVTVERVRQIKAKALRKLKHPRRTAILKYGADYYSTYVSEYQKAYDAKIDQIRQRAEIDAEDEAKLVAPKEMTIDELDLSVRAYNCITRRARFNTVKELVETIRTGEQLAKVRNMGKKSFAEVVRKVRERYDPEWLINDPSVEFILDQVK